MSQPGSQHQLGHLAKGDVIQVPIPFPDQEGVSKTRPALILMQSDGLNYVVGPFTTKPNREHKILVTNKDFVFGHFDNHEPSYFRPNIFHTIHISYIVKKYGTLREDSMKSIMEKAIELLNQPPIPKPAASKTLERPIAPKYAPRNVR